MITLDDFDLRRRKLLHDHPSVPVARYAVFCSEDWFVQIEIMPMHWEWTLGNYSGLKLSKENFSTPEAALDDLLACGNPVAVRALRAVFGDKYEEPTT